MTEQDGRLLALIDKLLLNIAVIAVCSLLVAQVVLFIDGTRYYVSQTDRLEGEQLAFGRPGTQEMPARVVIEPLEKLRRGKTLTIKMLSAGKQPNVFVRVNGRQAGNFMDGIVRLIVYENDYLDIDATRSDELIRYLIEGDAGFLLPIIGTELETKGDLAAIGGIRFK